MSKTRSISFTDDVFTAIEAARKSESRDRSNFINHKLRDYFVARGEMTPEGKVVRKPRPVKAAAAA